MESKIGTEAVPTYRESVKDHKVAKHMKANDSFCKTQNLSDILRNFDEGQDLGASGILSLNTSLQLNVD